MNVQSLILVPNIFKEFGTMWLFHTAHSKLILLLLKTPLWVFHPVPNPFQNFTILTAAVPIVYFLATNHHQWVRTDGWISRMPCCVSTASENTHFKEQCFFGYVNLCHSLREVLKYFRPLVSADSGTTNSTKVLRKENKAVSPNLTVFCRKQGPLSTSRSRGNDQQLGGGSVHNDDMWLTFSTPLSAARPKTKRITDSKTQSKEATPSGSADQPALLFGSPWLVPLESSTKPTLMSFPWCASFPLSLWFGVFSSSHKQSFCFLHRFLLLPTWNENILFRSRNSVAFALITWALIRKAANMKSQATFWWHRPKRPCSRESMVTLPFKCPV